MDFARSVENVKLHNSLRKVVHGNVELCRVRVANESAACGGACIEESGNDRNKGVETMTTSARQGVTRNNRRSRQRKFQKKHVT